MLKINNLQSGYGRLHVLRDIFIMVSEGEFVSIIGPNGAGKSTILKTIFGFIRPFSGSIQFGDKEISSMASYDIARLGIGYVTDDMNLFLGLSVQENLLMGGAITHKGGNKVKNALNYVWEMFPQLASRKKQLAGTLSGGERRMLAIARGIMGAPRLLLIDEPSLGLAPKVTKTVFEALKTLQREGITILLVEQNVNVALHISDRTYILENGCISLEGSRDDLLEADYIKKAYLDLV